MLQKKNYYFNSLGTGTFSTQSAAPASVYHWTDTNFSMHGNVRISEI